MATKSVTLERRIEYLQDLRKMYEKSQRVHGRESRQAQSMGRVLHTEIGRVRGKIGLELNEPMGLFQ